MLCTAFRELMEDSKAEGREEGRTQGIAAIIQDNHELGLSTDKIADKLQKYFSLSRQDALMWIAKYN